MSASDTHECPAPGCTLQMPRSTLACRAHWASLPANIRGAVTRAWRNVDNDLDAYLAARQEAVDFLESGQVAWP